MKNTRLLDQTTNVTRIDRWQIVIERQTYCVPVWKEGTKYNF